MYTFYYSTSCSLSRSVKSLLHFSNIDYQLLDYKYWEKDNFIPGEVFLPVLVDNELGGIEGHYPIIEYIVNIKPYLHIFPDKQKELHTMRKLLYEINDLMNRQVCTVMVYEKLLKIFMHKGTPDIKVLASARKRLSYYIYYFSHIIKKSIFLLYDRISMVDIALAAQISILDYFGEINWCKHIDLAEWYRIMKSLPAFNLLLKERLPSFNPPKHYSSLDF